MRPPASSREPASTTRRAITSATHAPGAPSCHLHRAGRHRLVPAERAGRLDSIVGAALPNGKQEDDVMKKARISRRKFLEASVVAVGSTRLVTARIKAHRKRSTGSTCGATPSGSGSTNPGKAPELRLVE